MKPPINDRVKASALEMRYQEQTRYDFTARPTSKKMNSAPSH